MGAVSWTPLVIGLAVAVVTIAALMGVTLALSLKQANWSIIDTFWGLGFVEIGRASCRERV